jgi:hypothetical protein
VTPALLAEIARERGAVINHFAAARALRALVPLSRLEALAAREEVRFIAPAARATSDRAATP